MTIFRFVSVATDSYPPEDVASWRKGLRIIAASPPGQVNDPLWGEDIVGAGF